MIYLEKFTLPGLSAEEAFLNEIKRTCYTSFYPFGIFPPKGLSCLEFEPITIFYGGNGSGKTTLLNVIAACIGAVRNAPCNKSSFFEDFAGMCSPQWKDAYHDSTVITSDDVFDYIFDIRRINESVDNRREALLTEHMNLKYEKFQMKSLSDYEKLKRINDARRMSGSEFASRQMMDNVRALSNGESALMYFTEKITQNQVYLLDEPENSLSAAYQQELLDFLENSARFFNCQFIIATHSPFILAAEQARIYDLDERPVCTKKWTELDSIKRYFNFFMKHRDAF